MTIQEILEAHRVVQVPTPKNFLGCACGMDFFSEIRSDEEFHREHVAEVLDKHMQEREAEAKATGYTEAADALHSEARWQYERHTRHMPGAQIVAQRMSLMEEIMRDRAKELTNGRE